MTAPGTADPDAQMPPSPPSPSYRRGYAAGQEDHAIGAGWGWPDESLGPEYSRGYFDGWHDNDREPTANSPDAPVRIPERLREIAERDLYDGRTDAPCEPAYSDLHDIADRLEAAPRPISPDDPEPAVGTRRWRAVSALSVHRESVLDTGVAYSSFQGWVLTCSWCDFTARGRTKADALAGMQRHYDEFGIEVDARVRPAGVR